MDFFGLQGWSSNRIFLVNSKVEACFLEKLCSCILVHLNIRSLQGEVRNNVFGCIWGVVFVEVGVVWCNLLLDVLLYF